jgi:pimeloyl-ACP methyl ester carboxylesterase
VSVTFTERTVEVIGAEVTLLEAGEGPPLIVFHEELGHPGLLAWHEAAARTHRVIVPIQPGFRTPRLPWMRSVRDLAVFYGFLMRQEGLVGAAAIGFSFGGWVAAEMAVQDPALFSHLALVAPFGIKPKEGFIFDMFPITSLDYLRTTVADPDATPEFAKLYGEPAPKQIEDWEDARTEIARIAWQPYMHDLSLPDLLRGLNGLKTLVLWGEADAVIPARTATLWAERIPDCRLRTFPGAGHRPETEATDAFVAAIKDFIG